MSQFSPLLQVVRGGKLESLHAGALVAVGPAGLPVVSRGDAHLPVFLRSTAKPFQAVPLLESGAADALAITDEELAVVCSSHGAEDVHLAAVSSLFCKAGVAETDLLCGTHDLEPGATRQLLEREGCAPSAIHHNCSGKHTGMLAYCAAHGLPRASYLDPDHPLQKSILEVISSLSEVPQGEIGLAVDGCSAPTFHLPLIGLARAFQKLAAAGLSAGGESNRTKALRRIFRAMTTFPRLAGAESSYDTEVMRAGAGNVLCKRGAESVHGLAVILPDRDEVLGIALKVADGDTARAPARIIVELLRQLGVLPDTVPAALQRYCEREIRNGRGIVVGEYRVVLG